jgi:hypothetical protein
MWASRILRQLWYFHLVLFAVGTEAHERPLQLNPSTVKTLQPKLAKQAHYHRHHHRLISTQRYRRNIMSSE